MRSWLTLRVILLVAVLFSLVRVLVVHSAHVGAVEWLVSGVLIAALAASIVFARRSPA